MFLKGRLPAAYVVKTVICEEPLTELWGKWEKGVVYCFVDFQLFLLPVAMTRGESFWLNIEEMLSEGCNKSCNSKDILVVIKDQFCLNFTFYFFPLFPSCSTSLLLHLTVFIDIHYGWFTLKTLHLSWKRKCSASCHDSTYHLCQI